MKPTGPVHFIHLGGEWLWQHWRAVETARRLQGFHTETIIWAVDPAVEFGFYPQHVKVRPLDLPAWLPAQRIIQHVKDYYAWKLLYEHGGICLDLDTISLRPAWDLLTADVCVSREYHPDDTHPHPYNSAVVLARKGAAVLLRMKGVARATLEYGESDWGETGPLLLTKFVGDPPASPFFSVAPYRALNGWSYHDIGDYYANPRDPGEDVRVIHLYSSSYMTQFENDRWMP